MFASKNFFVMVTVILYGTLAKLRLCLLAEAQVYMVLV